MTLYGILTPKERNVVEQTINEILKPNKIDQIFMEKVLIKIWSRRTDVYLISRPDLALIEQITSNLIASECILMHARIKLGFLIHEKFLIGVESLTFLAPFINKKIYLNKKQTEKFIYGKDIEVATDSLYNQIKDLKENSTILVFSCNDIPIGYAKICLKETDFWLQNLVDIGIYLRSEKSAF